MKILVVDDSALERQRIEASLRAQGHLVLLADNGFDGLELATQETPDVILLDVMMPGIDGLETARRIRSRQNHWSPIIFISANTQPEDIAAAIAAGGDDYLTKPINTLVLNAKLLAMRRIVGMKSLLGRLDTPAAEQEVAQATAVDSSTGLATEEAARHKLAQEFARCSRTQQPVSLLFASIDGLEAQRDSAPVEALQACLRQAALSLRHSAARISDFAAHFRQWQVGAILPDTPVSGALTVAERLRQTMNELCQTDCQLAVPPLCTLSIGLATAVPRKECDSQILIDAAERMLRQAINEGGNRIEALAIDAPFRLTPRELECLQWSALGKSSWEIAGILQISESAVNFHMANIRHKFQVSSRRQAIAQAIRLGLLRPS